MATETYRGVVRGGVVVLAAPKPPLTEGAEVLVTPLPAAGTGAAVLAALDASPRVPAGWVDELEDLIAEGRRPATHQDPFRDEPDGNGR
jgi:hypothetical protein